MLPLENRHLEGMEEPIDQIFHGLYVEQVEKATKSVLDEICEEINVGSDNYRNIRSCYLMNKRSVTKEKLCDWLETVCCILDQFSIPWLNIATPLAEEVQTLKDEKIADQKTIIDLQNNMIDKS